MRVFVSQIDKAIDPLRLRVLMPPQRRIELLRKLGISLFDHILPIHIILHHTIFRRIHRIHFDFLAEKISHCQQIMPVNRDQLPCFRIMTHQRRWRQFALAMLRVACENIADGILPQPVLTRSHLTPFHGDLLHSYSPMYSNRGTFLPSVTTSSKNISRGRTQSAILPNSLESYSARYTTNSSKVSLCRAAPITSYSLPLYCLYFPDFIVSLRIRLFLYNH